MLDKDDPDFLWLAPIQCDLKTIYQNGVFHEAYSNELYCDHRRLFRDTYNHYKKDSQD